MLVSWKVTGESLDNGLPLKHIHTESLLNALDVIVLPAARLATLQKTLQHDLFRAGEEESGFGQAHLSNASVVIIWHQVGYSRPCQI